MASRLKLTLVALEVPIKASVPMRQLENVTGGNTGEYTPNKGTDWAAF